MRIIGPPSASYGLVHDRLYAMALQGRVHDRFVSQMLDPLWECAGAYGIDPVGVVAQSFKETGAGKFGGRITEQWYNTCGLKIRHPGIVPAADGDAPLAHAMFASWDVGALAHVQHICAYTGQPVSQLQNVPIVDPRYDLVIGSRLENWSELGGHWAPSPTYGTEIEALMVSISRLRPLEGG